MKQTQLKEVPSLRETQPVLRDLQTLAAAHVDFTIVKLLNCEASSMTWLGCSLLTIQNESIYFTHYDEAIGDLQTVVWS